MTDLLPFGLGARDLASAMAAISAVCTVVFVWFTLIERDPLPGRLKALDERRRAMKAGIVRPTRRKSVVAGRSLMREVVNRLKLMRGQSTKNLTLKLARAGFRSRDALVVYLFAKLTLPILSGAVALLFFQAMNVADLPALANTAICGAAVLFGLYLPDIFVKNAAQKRTEKIRKALPDAFDLMVICAEAGLSLDATLDRVAREIGGASPELTDELGLASLELSFLPDRHKALEGLAERVPLSQVRALVSTLVQTERYGTPLAASLRVLAGELRHERLMRAEEKAARLPAIMTVPMIVFILPPLFIVLMGPAALSLIDQLGGM
jgi:tight adherence protein C